MTDIAQKQEKSGASGGLLVRVSLVAAFLLALFFYFNYVVKYFSWNVEAYTPRLWAERFALIVHIAGATLALFIGPIQLWTGLSRTKMNIHRLTGTLYLSGLAIAVIGAVAMLPSTAEFALHYAIGIGGLAAAWTVTGGMAFYAIRKRNYDQHKEWMIRSYVVTFAFVTIRVVDDYIPHGDLGMTPADFAGLMAWTSWVVPLMISETIMQGRKI